MSPGSPVESVRRAFALLEELNRQRINSVQHLHEVTALPKSTIVRLCGPSLLFLDGGGQA